MSFAIVAKFSRKNDIDDFFYHRYQDHPVVLEIKNRFESTGGHVGKSILVDSFEVFEVALVFETQEDFIEFVLKNENILQQRNDLINEYCEKTGHRYEYYSIPDFSRDQFK